MRGLNERTTNDSHCSSPHFPCHHRHRRHCLHIICNLSSYMKIFISSLHTRRAVTQSSSTYVMKSCLHEPSLHSSSIQSFGLGCSHVPPIRGLVICALCCARKFERGRECKPCASRVVNFYVDRAPRRGSACQD